MSQPFVAEIIIAGFNFAPRGFAFCNGQLISIAQNTALFSLLGTTYGGNGQSNFALPDLQGRAANHLGQGPGLSDYVEGQFGGEEVHKLINAEVPIHNHGVTTTESVSVNGNLKTAGGNLPAGVQGTNTNIYSTAASNATNTGMFAVGGLPHNNLQPLLVLNFCIAMQGIYPARS
jgi:microcystin-dependent protein